VVPTARELLQRRADQRAVQELRAALTGLRGKGVRSDEDVLTDWSRVELASIGRSGSTPDASLRQGADPTAWLSDLEEGADLGSRIFLGTGLRSAPWLDCEVATPGWLAEAWDRAGDDLRVVSADHRRLLVLFDEEHEIQAFRRSVPR
jgi:hypothetical protein